jgi:hypothetical protein
MKRTKNFTVLVFCLVSILFASYSYGDNCSQDVIRLYVANEAYLLEGAGNPPQVGELSYIDGKQVSHSFEPQDYEGIHDWGFVEEYPGSFSRPYKSVQHAVDMVKKHQETYKDSDFSYMVFIKKGYYLINEPIIIPGIKNLTVSGAAVSYPVNEGNQDYEMPVIEFRKAEGDGHISMPESTRQSLSAPAVDCSATVPAMLITGASNTVIQNLTLSGGESAVIHIKNSSYITVTNCNLSHPVDVGCGTGCIDTWKSSPLTIFGNYLESQKASGNGDWTDHAIYVIGYNIYTGGNDFLITDNYCVDGGIKLRGADSQGIRNAMVTYNIIDGAKQSFVLATKAHSLYITDNTVYSNSYTAIAGLNVTDIGWGIRFQNNTIYLKTTEDKYWWGPSMALVHGFSNTNDYNNIYIMRENHYYGSSPISYYNIHIAWTFSSLQDLLNTKDFFSTFN